LAAACKNRLEFGGSPAEPHALSINSTEPQMGAAMATIPDGRWSHSRRGGSCWPRRVATAPASVPI